MFKMASTENVAVQYADDKNLSARINLHAKHSTNSYGFSNWLFDRYKFTTGCRILELGCGTGGVWEGRINSLPAGSLLVLSDLSDGMVNSVWEKYVGCHNVLVQRIDIQDILFPAGSFDFVIANHMLYMYQNCPKRFRKCAAY